MEKRIKMLRQHYIVCGFGRVGRNIAQELYSTGRHFVAIDPDASNFEMSRERFPGLLYLHGDASDDDLMIAADVANARGVFAVTAMTARTSWSRSPRNRSTPGCASSRAATSCETRRNCARPVQTTWCRRTSPAGCASPRR